MKRRDTLFYFLIFTTLLVLACSKGVPVQGNHTFNPNDSTKPTVVIVKPSSNQVFKSGDVIQVSGKVADNGLYQGSIRIVNDATGVIVKEQLYDIHDYQAYDFDLEYQVNVFVVSNYTITVEFNDHGLNVGSQSVKVKINP